MFAKLSVLVLCVAFVSALPTATNAKSNDLAERRIAYTAKEGSTAVDVRDLEETTIQSRKTPDERALQDRDSLEARLRVCNGGSDCANGFRTSKRGLAVTSEEETDKVDGKVSRETHDTRAFQDRDSLDARNLAAESN